MAFGPMSSTPAERVPMPSPTERTEAVDREW
jgi:hypothetical protein